MKPSQVGNLSWADMCFRPELQNIFSMNMLFPRIKLKVTKDKPVFVVFPKCGSISMLPETLQFVSR